MFDDIIPTNILRLLKTSCQILCHYLLNNVILLSTRREFIINTMKKTTNALNKYSTLLF